MNTQKTFRAYFFTKYGLGIRDIKADTFLHAYNKLPQKYKKNNTSLEDLETNETKEVQEILTDLAQSLIKYLQTK